VALSIDATNETPENDALFQRYRIMGVPAVRLVSADLSKRESLDRFEDASALERALSDFISK
jgi:thiol:disulfide interchange protein